MRPCERMPARSPCFNPHPARRPDAIPPSTPQRSRWCQFQSSPGQKAGCNLPCPLGRCLLEHGFNPHPARRPDAITSGQHSRFSQPCFNPHPARRPDAIRWRQSRSSSVILKAMFQSSPGQKAGCNLPVQFEQSDHPPVSILTRPEGRMQ